MPEKEIREVSNAAIEAFKTWTGNAGYAIKHWPHGSCDFASYVIGGALLEHAFGDREITWNGSSKRSGAHTWLERRADEPSTAYVIDATVHQFPKLASEPYFGTGPSPARTWFDQESGRERISELSWGRGSYKEALAYVLGKIA